MTGALLLLAASLALAGPRGVVKDAPPPRNLERAWRPRRVAMVVGIDTYTDPALGNLKFAAKDTRDLSDVLVDPSLGGFDVVSQVAGTVTRESFWSSFDAATGYLQRDDTFLLYIAGHGTLDLSGEGTLLYVLPSDGWLADAAASGIALTDIEAAIERLPSRRRVLVMDTCHSGGGRSVLSPATKDKMQGLRGPLPSPAALEVSRWDVRLFAAHLNQPAVEDPGLQNGVYTHYLIQALGGAGDIDGDGLIDVLEAHDFARDRTLEFTGGLQVPWVEATMVGRDAIFLSGDPSSRKRAEWAIIEGLEALPRNAVLKVDGITRGAGAVQPGWRRMAVEVDGRPVLAQPVRVRRGDRLDLGDLVRDREAWGILQAGGAWHAANDWIPTWAVRVGGWYLPADPAGARWAFGASASRSLGGVPGLDPFPTGTVVARAGAWAGRAFLVGPTVGGGVAWRLPETGGQTGWLVAPGLHLQYAVGAFVLALDPSADIVAIRAGQAFLPDVSFTTGVRF